MAVVALLPGCVSITTEPRALLLAADGQVSVELRTCAREPVVHEAAADALDPAAIRILTWNLHKQDNAGWQHDLSAFVAHNDIVLLQEAVLDPALRGVVEGGGMRWVMASSFLFGQRDIGVVSAARKAPLASCTLRAQEPLIRLPKSAVITWFRLRGSDATLAVVNVHAINFALTLRGYRAQLFALADALAAHRGPIVFAGDLNTWTAARGEVMRDVAARLALQEVRLREDRRSLFLGKQLDHIYVRGLMLVDAEAIPVHSSDHNPVRATLRLAPAAQAGGAVLRSHASRACSTCANISRAGSVV
jgi:endonuclease/exonuclease/phosphatase (EEP) superfamily protein YafD